MSQVRCGIVFLVVAFVGSAAAAFGADGAATVYSIQGTVEHQDVTSGAWGGLAVGQSVRAGELVRTGPGSRAALVLADGLMVRLNQNSRFEVKVDAASTPAEITLAQGDAHFFSRKEREFPTIKTELVSASIRGTELTVSARPGMSEVAVLAGLVRAENNLGGVDLAGGELATVVPGKAPQKAILVDPVHAVQWALYYPAALDIDDLPESLGAPSADEERGIAALRRGDSPAAQRILTGPSALRRLGRAIALYQLGDSDGALRVLGTDSPSPSFDLARAALALGRGQVEAAADFLTRAEAGAVKLPADDAERLIGAIAAQRAVIAVTRNQLEEARRLADESVRRAPGTPGAALALSYVEQGSGLVEAAFEAIVAALRRHPENPALLLRRAELQLSRGESEAALEDVDRVIAVMPGNGYGLTVRGFAQLARLDVEGAKISFTKAIDGGAGDGLPFLGLGLTQIRRGDLESGRTSIQQAAHLEPARALYRSYLGKALFEQENESLAAEEYERAIALDPKDPTPYLYRTFLSLSKNDPIKALDDIETSIKLNDNRSVYRSRLLLDQDASVRSSSLAEVYNALGFPELSRIEALRALSEDYSNYSAHLDLSQSYESTANLLQSSISEFFIARLLAPVSFNLVRPSASGGISSNDYTAVFDRDQSRTSFEFDGRTKDEFAAPGLLFSGTEGRWGWALSHSPTYSDGYRENDRSSDLTTYGSLQYQLSPETALLFDAGAETFDTGDTDIGFDPNTNDPDENNAFDDYLLRLGMNHRFSSGSQLIGQVVGSHSNIRLDDPTFNRFLYVYLTAGDQILDALTIQQFVDQRFRFKSNNIRGDLQHIYNSAAVSNVLGGGLYNGSQDQDENAVVPIPPETGTPLESSAENTEASRRLYDYLTLHVTPWLDIQGGVSYAHLHLGGAPLSLPFTEDVESQEILSPKAGVIVSPTDSTTLRAAYFETTSSAGVREVELIEPTVVSGFNQTFFEIFPGTKARTVGLGVDQKLPTKTYLGVELIRRAVTRDYPISVSQIFYDLLDDARPSFGTYVQENDAHIDDHQFRTYIYQVLGSRVSLTSDFIQGIQEDNLLNSETDSQRIRLGVNYFDPSGWFGFTRATWRNQALTSNVDPTPEASASSTMGDSFWLMDLGLGYRFPKRHGQLVLSLNNIFDTDFNYIAPGYETVLLPGIYGGLSFSINF